MPAIEKQIKPLCPLLGAEQSIYEALDMANRALYETGDHDGMAETTKKVFESLTIKSSFDVKYRRALSIISEYVSPVTRREYESAQQ
jgi:hypothetical protein